MGVALNIEQVGAQYSCRPSPAIMNIRYATRKIAMQKQWKIGVARNDASVLLQLQTNRAISFAWRPGSSLAPRPLRQRLQFTRRRSVVVTLPDLLTPH